MCIRDSNKVNQVVAPVQKSIDTQTNRAGANIGNQISRKVQPAVSSGVADGIKQGATAVGKAALKGAGAVGAGLAVSKGVNSLMKGGKKKTNEELSIDETYFDTNRRGISTKGGFVKQYNKPGKLSRASLNHERKSKNPELRMSKKELRKSMEDDANYEKKMGRSKPTPSNLKTALKKMKEDYYRGTGEKVVARTKKWMKKKGQEGAPGLDAMKARSAEHKAKRGVKEDFVTEVIENDNPDANVKKIDVMKGKNKVKINPNMGEQVETDTKQPEDVGLNQKERQANMLKKRVLMQKLKAVRSGAGDSIMASHTPEGEVVEGVIDMVKKGAKRHAKAVEKKKIKNRKAVPYAALGAVSYTHLTLPTSELV